MLKKITVDFSSLFSLSNGTLSGRVEPDLVLIRKINIAFNVGFEIDVSYDPLVFEREPVHTTLTDHGVLFHGLVKEITHIRITEHAISADILGPITTEGQRPGAPQFTISHWATYADKDPVASAHWYTMAGHRFKVPVIYHVGSKTLTRHAIELRGVPAPVEICGDIITMFKDLPASNSHDWGHYCQTVKHCLYNAGEHLHRLHKNVYGRLQDIEDVPLNTFAHGDMKPENVIEVERNKKYLFYLINPDNSTYMSYTLDRARLDAWGIVNEIERPDGESWALPTHLHVLVAAECIRILTRLKPSTKEKLLVYLAENT